MPLKVSKRITLRAWLAGQALQGLISSFGDRAGADPKHIAKLAVDHADEVIKRLHNDKDT